MFCEQAVGHILFGSDSPFDAELGRNSKRVCLEMVDRMGIPGRDKEKILQGNARRLLGLR